MTRIGQSVQSAEATPAAAPGSRRRALLAQLPTDDEILSSISRQPTTPPAPKSDAPVTTDQAVDDLTLAPWQMR